MTNVLEARPGAETATRRLRWWVEVLTAAAFYVSYNRIRNLHASTNHDLVLATRNAYRIVRLERYLHVFVEADAQHAFIHHRLLIRFLDAYYGAADLVAVIAVLAWLFFVHADRYRPWRNVLALCTGAALVGYAFFPEIPPRLLPFDQFHIVDTLRVVGGLWNFSSRPVSDVSDEYAAMPSLHTAWAMWCAMAVASNCKPRWVKVVVFAYPMLTIFCIVVTGNHYFADVAGGLLALALAYLVVGLASRLRPRLRRPGRPLYPEPASVP